MRGDETTISKEQREFARHCQELEDALWFMYFNRNVGWIPNPLNTARNTLDDFGDNCGQQRQGLTDANYVIALAAKIAANKSKGTPEQILSALRSILRAFGNTTPDIHHFEFYPMCVYLTFVGTSAPAGLAQFMQAVGGGGVRICVVMLNPVDPFRYDTTGQGYDLGKLGTLIV